MRHRRNAEDRYLLSLATLEMEVALQHAAAAVARDSAHVLAITRSLDLNLALGRLDQAYAASAQLAHLGELSARRPFLQASIRARQGRYDEAIELYSEFATDDAGNGAAWRGRAKVMLMARNYEQCIADLTQSIAYDGLETGNVWDFYFRATPLWILGRLEEAVGDLRQARVFIAYPTYGDVRLYLILRELGRVAEAQEVLADALRDAQDNWLTAILDCVGGRTSPETLVAGVDRDNKQHVCEAFYYAGEACLLAGRRTDALEYFQRCVDTELAADPDAATFSPMSENVLASWRRDQAAARRSRAK